MTRGGKDDKKKDKPDTPESSTTPSSAPSVTDDTRQLLPEARGRTSSHQSRSGKKKPKSVTSEPSTPPSSELSVVDDNTALLQSSAHASTKDSQKAVAGTGSPHAGLGAIFSGNALETTRGKNRLAVPDQGAGGSRSPSKSPSKSPSVFSQMKKSLVRKFSPKKKSPKRSIGSESQNESPSKQKTEFPDAKHKSLAESASNISEATLKEDGQNTGSSNSSGSSVKVSSDDAPQSENYLNVPGPKSVARSPKSPKKNLSTQFKYKLYPEKRKDKVHSKDSSSSSSSKSESSSSVTSHISKKRQESNASNISSENSRSSNSKSSGISCAHNKESLHPDMLSSGRNSGESVENPNFGIPPSADICYDTMGRNLSRARKRTVTQRLDNLYFGEESKHRSRSIGSGIVVDPEEYSSSKDDSKERQEDGSDHESQKGATSACSVEPVERKSPGIGSNEIGVDIQGAIASCSDPSVRKKDTVTHRTNAQSGDGSSDPSVRKKDTVTHRTNAQSGDGRSNQSVRMKDTSVRRCVDASSGIEADRLVKSVGKKDEAQQRGAEERLSRMDTEPRREDALDIEAIWKTPLSPLFQRDGAATPSFTFTRHQSLSPKCRHRYIHTPNCSTTTRLTERRIIRERRNQRKCKQPKNFNSTFVVFGEKREAVRQKHKNLRDARNKLPKLEEHVKKIIRNLNPSRVEIENSQSSLEAVDEYSSRLQEVREYFMRLQEKIKEMIENSNVSSLDDIGRNISIHDQNVDQFLNGIDPNRLEVPGSNFSRLEEALEIVSSFEMQLEEIRNNVGFSCLESVSENLSRIYSEMELIQQTVNLTSLMRVLVHLWDLRQVLQKILEKISWPNEQVPGRN